MYTLRKCIQVSRNGHWEKYTNIIFSLKKIISDKSVHLNVCIPAKEVPGLSRVGISLQRFLQTLDSIALSAGSVPKLFNCVMHPA